MCLIIDANCATVTLSSNPSAEFAPVMHAILAKNAVMVLGGTKLRGEYQKLSTVWRFIVALDRAGKTKAYSDTAIDALQAVLEKSGMLKSDDPHILALAQVSGARLLCSKDQDLHHDFLSKNLIDNPRGSIYQNKSHAPLLRKCCNQ
jgi:hypothetical protein